MLFDLKPFGVIHFIIGYRLWQGLAGLITALLVVYFLSAEQQGWYFTFMSLAALYSIFEMGLSLVVVQVIAKLFLDIRWDVCGEIIGRNRAQLLAILQSGLRVYFVLAGLFIVCSLIAGWWMFTNASNDAAEAVRWQLPWLGLVVLTASSMILLFFWAILEGAGKLLEVYRLRLCLAVAGSVLCWLILSMGGFLWATLAIPLIGTIFGIGWMSLYQKKILTMARSHDRTAMNYWNREVWPLQWRVGIYWISIFMMSQLVTPILFLSQGAIIAGQMGLSLTIAHMVGIIAQAWIARSVPDMTQAVARHDWSRLDTIFRRNFRNSIITFFAGTVAVAILYWAAGDWGFSKRLLPWQEMVGLMVFVLSYHLHNTWAAQLRSFHKEPLGGTFLVGAGLILLGSVMLVDRFSAAGAVIIMVVVQAIFILPTSWWIWRRCNQQWRH